MTTQGTSRRRRVAAAAAALTLVLLSGCSLDDGAEPNPGAAPAVESPPTSTATPSDRPSTTPGPSTPAPPADHSADGDDEGTAGPEVDPTPGTSPSTRPGTGESTTPPGNGEANRNGKANGNGKGAQDDKKPDHVAYGATGERVAALQQRLQELGYFVLEADGVYGPATQQAVWALQKAAGLYRDGVVGPKTQDALRRGVRPTPVSSSGRVVEIDLDRQLLLAVEDGRVVRTINASSGNGELFTAQGRTYRATTPRGTFAVYLERNYLHESTLELGAMYRPKYVTGSIAVHGSPSIPPWPASHGCVRVSNSAMNWLWDSWGMPKGTTVIVH
jgi:hypothetical protein